MNFLTRPVSLVLALVLALSAVVALWFGTVPQMLSPRGYMVTVTLMIALAAISMITIRNAQGTTSVAHLLYETDTAPLPATARDQRTVQARKRP